MQQTISRTVSQVNLVVAQTKKIVSDFQHAQHIEQIDVDLMKKRVIELYDIIMTIKIDETTTVNVTKKAEDKESNIEEEPKSAELNREIAEKEEKQEVINEEVASDENVTDFKMTEKEDIREEEEIEREEIEEEGEETIEENEDDVESEVENSKVEDTDSNDDGLEIDDKHEEVEKIEEEVEKVVAAKSVADILGKVIGRPTFSIVPRQSIAESMEHEGISIGERLTQNQSPMFTEKPIKDIKSALDINDKLMMTKELFDNNADRFGRAISILNGFGNKGEALFFLESLKKEQNWHDEMESFIKLKSIIEKKRY